MLPPGLHVKAAIVVSAVDPGTNASLRLRLTRFTLVLIVPMAQVTLLPMALTAVVANCPIPGFVIKMGVRIGGEAVGAVIEDT
jgi:hypothetical protein